MIQLIYRRVGLLAYPCFFLFLSLKLLRFLNIWLARTFSSRDFVGLSGWYFIITFLYALSLFFSLIRSAAEYLPGFENVLRISYSGNNLMYLNLRSTSFPPC